MAILRIRTWGDPVLKVKTREVKDITHDLRRLVKDMFETLQAEGGVGLAANQVGEPYRLFIAEIPAKAGPSLRYVFINPVISSLGPETETLEEGCLSFPGIYAPVERSLEVEVTSLDLAGKPQTIRGSGLLARVLQHETDHLDATVFIERMKMVQRLMLSRPLRELARHTQATLAGHGTPRI